MSAYCSAPGCTRIGLPHYGQRTCQAHSVELNRHLDKIGASGWDDKARAAAEWAKGNQQQEARTTA